MRGEALDELMDCYIRLALMEGETFSSWKELNAKFDVAIIEYEANIY